MLGQGGPDDGLEEPLGRAGVDHLQAERVDHQPAEQAVGEVANLLEGSVVACREELLSKAGTAAEKKLRLCLGVFFLK